MLSDLLKQLLASNFAYYLKAQFFHWNVEGRDFYEYHKFFQDIYEDAYSAVDTIAESIRTLDSYAPGKKKKHKNKKNRLMQNLTMLKSSKEMNNIKITKTFF